MSLGKHMTASAVKIVMLLDVERSGYNECCATSAIFCNVTFLTVFLFCYTISRENRNKISENSFGFISSYTFFCIAVLYTTVCQSRHHVVSRSWVLSHVHRVLIVKN